MSDKIYAPISIEQRAWPDGKPLWRIGIMAAEMIAFLQKHVNERGYVNLTMSARREPGKHGDTHYATLDTWKPKERNQQSGARDDTPF